MYNRYGNISKFITNQGNHIDKLFVSGTTAICAVLCAIVMSFTAPLSVAAGLLVCWLFCAFLIWVGETAWNALSSGRTYGRNIGAGIVCVLLPIPAIIELCRDLNTPKPPADQILNFWGMGSFLLFLMIGPPVLAAIVLNAAAVIARKRHAAKDITPSRSAKAVGFFLRAVLGLAGYATVLLLLQLFY